MAAKKKGKGQLALMKINRRAKQIVSRTGCSWKVGRSKAAAEYRADKKGSTRKKVSAKKKRSVGKARPRRPSVSVGKDRVDNKRVSVSIGGISKGRAKGIVREAVKDELKSALFRRDQAKRKTDKRRINKQITKLRTELRGYSS